jgi:hypothetical protein
MLNPEMKSLIRLTEVRECMLQTEFNKSDGTKTSLQGSARTQGARAARDGMEVGGWSHKEMAGAQDRVNRGGGGGFKQLEARDGEQVEACRNGTNARVFGWSQSG